MLTVYLVVVGEKMPDWVERETLQRHLLDTVGANKWLGEMS